MREMNETEVLKNKIFQLELMLKAANGKLETLEEQCRQWRADNWDEDHQMTNWKLGWITQARVNTPEAVLQGRVNHAERI